MASVGAYWCPNCGCDSGRVLIWRANSHASWGGTLIGLQAIYENMGLTVHTHSNWSGTLSDYSLIHFPVAISDPSWWSQISGNTWRGRLHMTAENNNAGTFDTSITYVDGKSGITGMGIFGDTINFLCSHNGTVEADDMTAGVTLIKYSLTSRVTSGTPLSKASGNTWLARNKPSGSNIDFIVSGDVNHMDDTCAGVIAANTKLLENMFTVPV